MGQGDGNIFERVPERLPEEQTIELLAAPGLKIERIVSTGQASPAGFWYDQDRAEWVLVLAGSAGLLIEGELEPRVLGPGYKLQGDAGYPLTYLVGGRRS